jgi:hypothetical protein
VLPLSNGCAVSVSTGGSGADGFIASESARGEEQSPLQMILNYEILLGLLILAHMSILILIGLHKLYISSGLNIISKILSKKQHKKLHQIKEKIDKIGNIYLIILIVINVLFILFYIFFYYICEC